ncbi:putative orfan [Tupanvirus soda lake]|uniref:Orfan n=2 Tax=Tupanvirus TaxID=2094720 RepID=A0AC62AAZ9_9VIRU|nr:putative orfan [Tupanvirus soda lake]QKU34914.1 putative orfan [Tupanvirus soda lake]
MTNMNMNNISSQNLNFNSGEDFSNELEIIYPKTLLKKGNSNIAPQETSKKIIAHRYHKQLFNNNNTINCQIVPSTMCIKNNDDDTLRINLLSPIFDESFDNKKISKISLKKNSHGSIDLFIKFDKNIKNKSSNISSSIS